MLVEITDLVKNLAGLSRKHEAKYESLRWGRLQPTGDVNPGRKGDEPVKKLTVSCNLALTKPGINPKAIFTLSLPKTPAVTSQLTPDEIEQCFDPQHHLKHLDEVYQRLGI
jgi:adenylosuccinate lyase